ncbi:ABA4-like family protein [Fibrella arboris]|uniref:ABA4-like family protein n=1 Tax=Fibrella arboris TaxID=3242486 RepID=UPI00352237DB
MSYESAFSLANALVFPQWLLMLTAPRWHVTQWLTRTLLIPALLAILYAYYLFTSTGGTLDFMSFATLKGVMTLFEQGGEGVLLAGWIHYLAFDLVAGCWILRDAQQYTIAHGWLVPCLLFCFMLGPLGMLLYVLIRGRKGLSPLP